MSIRIEAWDSIKELVRMSIGTDKGTWFADPGFGSELWLLKKAGKADGQTAGTPERMIRECLQWLPDDSPAASIDRGAERSGKNRIDYRITVIRPDGSPVTVQEVWNVI